MTYSADLAPLDYFTPGETFGNRLRGAGWLSLDHEYSQGDVEAHVIEQLVDILEHGHEIIETCGYHQCLLCPGREHLDELDPRRIHGEPIEYRHGGRSYTLGAANLWVPAGDLMYVSPSLVLHYVEEHGYRPPDEFLSALGAAPKPNTHEYSRAIDAFWSFMQSTILEGAWPT